jgi:hypothetical protein
MAFALRFGGGAGEAKVENAPGRLTRSWITGNPESLARLQAQAPRIPSPTHIEALMQEGWPANS